MNRPSFWSEKYKYDNNAYESMLNEINTGDIVVFIGAGLSALFGFPTTRQLTMQMIEVYYRMKLITLNEFNRYKEYIKKGDLMQMIDILSKIDKKVYEANLISYFNDEAVKIKTKILLKKKYINELIRFLTRDNISVLTTNYDTMLEILMNIDCSTQPCSPHGSTSSKLTYLHGNYRDVGNIILTAASYAQYVTTSNNKLVSFIKEIILNKTIIFIGYSFNYDNQLKILLRNDFNEREHKRFWIRSDHSVNDLNAEWLFKECKIVPIYYDFDDAQYETILKVIMELNEDSDKIVSEGI